MRQLFFAAAVLSTAAFAQTEYFPLQSGNTWVYRVSGRVTQPPVVMSVGDQVTMDGVSYFDVAGVPGVGRAMLRYNEAGKLVAFDDNRKAETPWLAFDAGLGEEFESHVHQCVSSAQIRERAAKESTPVGTFDNLMQVQYGSFTCADAGTTEDAFAPHLGLVKRTETTFAGPRTYELVYARVGNSTLITQAEHAFSLSIDKVIYDSTQPLEITARVAIRNSTNDPLELFFPSTQIYNFAIMNDKGEGVYNWAATRLFAQVTQTIQVKGERVWMDSFAVPRLPAGKYTLEAILTTAPAIVYKSTVGFTIK